MTHILRQSTAANLKIGPFVDATDGNTADSGVVPTVSVSKNGAAFATKNDATTPTHDSMGYYLCPVDATDTNTCGTLLVVVEGDTGHLAVRHELQVVEELVYDRIYATNATAADTGTLRNFANWVDTGIHDIVADLDTGLRDYINDTDTGLRAYIDNVDTGLHGYVASDTGIHDAIDNVDTGIAGKLVTALSVTTYAEPGQEAPGATVSLATKVGYIYKAWRNRHTQDTGSYDLYNDDATTIGQTANTTDDGATFDRGEVGSGV